MCVLQTKKLTVHCMRARCIGLIGCVYANDIVSLSIHVYCIRIQSVMAVLSSAEVPCSLNLTLKRYTESSRFVAYM